MVEWVEADALVTTMSNMPIGVITADCAPILMVGQIENGESVVGAAHAGWQGALNGVIENTIKMMACDPNTIQAYIGPCIGQSSYEVSKGYEIPFIQHDPESMRFFVEKNTEKLLFHLKGYCAWRLTQSGVQKVEISDVDTLVHGDYHSHRGGAKSNERNLSVIMIEG